MEMSDGDENGTDTINVVPLADLTLVLLIIMMLLAPASMSSMIRVETPKVEKVRSIKKKEIKKDSEPLFIKLTSKGLFLNNTLVESVDFLGEQIAIKLTDDPERPVILAADDDVSVGEVVHVVARGFRTLDLHAFGGVRSRDFH